MNQVGIGQLKHAKANFSASQGTQVAVENKGRLVGGLSKKRREQTRSEAEGPTQKEGQLAVDILQTDTEMLIICPIAGVEKSDIKVAIQDDVLTIRGERRQLKEIEGKTPLVKELFWGTFSRSIVLPDYIDRKNISARVHEHLLTITIPKTEDFKTRIIHINE